MLASNTTKEVPCHNTGSYLRIQAQKGWIPLTICDVEILIAGRTGSDSEAGCPLDLDAFAWQGTGDLQYGRLFGGGHYFETKQEIRRPASVYAEVRSVQGKK